MKRLLLIFWFISFIFFSCRTNEEKEIDTSIDEERTFSKLSFLIDCYGCKMEIEELVYFYELKHRRYLKFIKKREEDYSIDLVQVRRDMVRSNPGNIYIQADFLNPWKEPPALPSYYPRRGWMFSPNHYPNGYRYNAPINVKPGHLF